VSVALHCWKDRSEHAEHVHGWGSDPYWAAVFNSGTCMLEAGHEGDHEFTPDHEIGVTFSGEAPQ
jgi:hypothetical protein